MIAALGVLLPIGARAEQPLCFDERTVLEAAELRDARGRVLGGLRAGHTVRVLRDRVGKDRASADVEVTTPIRLAGRVPRSALVVFAREDIELVKDRLWWLAQRPLALERDPSKRDHARVMVHKYADESPYPVVSVPCDRLSGRPVAALFRDECRGALPGKEASPRKDEEREGQAVWWLLNRPEVPLSSLLPEGSRTRRRLSVRGARLIRRDGDRAFIEAIDWGDDVRFRAWVSAIGMRDGPSEVGTGTSYPCDARLESDPGWHAGFLSQATPVRQAPGEQPFAVLPEGALVRWSSVDHTGVAVTWRWPRVAETDANGRFWLAVPPMALNLHTRHPTFGNQDASVALDSPRAGDTHRLTLRLKPSEPVLRPFW